MNIKVDNGVVTLIPTDENEHAAALAFVQAFGLVPRVNVGGLPIQLGYQQRSPAVVSVPRMPPKQ